MSIFFPIVHKNISDALSDLEKLDYLIPKTGWIDEKVVRRLKEGQKKIDMTEYDNLRFEMLLRAIEKKDVDFMRAAEGLHSRLASREKNNLAKGQLVNADFDRELRERIIRNTHKIRLQVSKTISKALDAKTRLAREEQFRSLQEILRSAEKILREAILLESEQKIEKNYERHIAHAHIDVQDHNLVLCGGHTFEALKEFETKLRTCEKDFSLNKCSTRKNSDNLLEEFVFPEFIGGKKIVNRVKGIFPRNMSKRKICDLAQKAVQNARKRQVLLNYVEGPIQDEDWVDRWVGEAGGFIIMFDYLLGTRVGADISEATLNTFFPLMPDKVKKFDSTQ